MSDVMTCFGKCKNGGVCQDGACECTVGYTGQFCESVKGKEETENQVNVAGYLITFLAFVIICSLLATTVYFFFHQDKIPQPLLRFLNANCPWCLRKQSIIEEDEPRESHDQDAPVVQRERMVIQMGGERGHHKSHSSSSSSDKS